MATGFDKHEDAGTFMTVYFDKILPQDHPARFIKKFVAHIDINNFKNKYETGPGKAGRPPKDVRMMLGIILYAIFKRIYSAHQIEYATEHFADFWLFSCAKKISHDKISRFLNKHADDIHAVFLETIFLASKNDLISFEGLYIDGFYMPAKASVSQNYTFEGFDIKKEKLSEALTKVLAKLSEDKDEKVLAQKRKIEEQMERIKNLETELNDRIAEYSKGDAPYKAKERYKKANINATDPDAEIMKMKDDSYKNSYSKQVAVDPKADIVVSSDIDGHFDEPNKLIGLIEDANSNCKGLGKYTKVAADAGYNTFSNCKHCEESELEFISPTRQHENDKKNPDSVNRRANFTYDENEHIVVCSEGAVLNQSEKWKSKKKNAVIYKFSNPEACKKCKRVFECTQSKNGYKTFKVDERIVFQQKVLERYKSKEGKKFYKKRMHSGEVFQGDLKKNGRFNQMLRCGLEKAKVDSMLHDITWNLRKIFNTIAGDIVWNS